MFTCTLDQLRVIVAKNTSIDPIIPSPMAAPLEMADDFDSFNFADLPLDNDDLNQEEELNPIENPIQLDVEDIVEETLIPLRAVEFHSNDSFKTKVQGFSKKQVANAFISLISGNFELQQDEPYGDILII